MPVPPRVQARYEINLCNFWIHTSGGEKKEEEKNRGKKSTPAIVFKQRITSEDVNNILKLK